MPDFKKLILRKFNYIAGSRYEEIMKAYREFLLTEEEMEIPVISSVLLVVDRFSEKPPDEIYDVLTSYPGAFIKAIYLIDGRLCALIRETLGEEAAKKFRINEKSMGEEFIRDISGRLSQLGVNFSSEILFEDKASFVEDAMEDYDLLVISKHFGSEGLKTYNITPLAFRIVQRIEKPVILY